MSFVSIGPIVVGHNSPLTLIAGPCVIEDTQTLIDEARALQNICLAAGVPLIFKASFDKANRTSLDSYRGPGMEQGLAALAQVKNTLGIPVTTDIHLPEQAAPVSKVVDLIQIPAFLARQTDLLVAAAKTGLPINIKKAQFLSPADMTHAVKKVQHHSDAGVILTERGTSFGYNNLVVDFRSIAQMKACGTPVCFDATHATQQPGGQGKTSGGDREMAPLLARAAIAAGADLLFMEVHKNPAKAKSDAATQLPIDQLPELLEQLLRIKIAILP